MPLLPGHRPDRADAVTGARPARNTRMTVTVLLRAVDEPLLTQLEARRDGDPDFALSRESLWGAIRPPAERFARLVRHFLASGLHPAAGADGLLLRLEGDLSAVEDAFGLTLLEAEGPDGTLFLPDGEPALPSPLDRYVLAVYGLDNLARPRRLGARPPSADGGTGFLPADIARLYDFPPDLAGAGETIAMPGFRGGFATGDLLAFWRLAGVSRPLPVAVPAQGGGAVGPAPGDVDATLDVAWAGALAPAARLVVYEARVGDDYASFAEALTAALHAALVDRRHAPTVLSLPAGDGEGSVAPAAVAGWERLAELLAAIGVTVLAAAGDRGPYGLDPAPAAPTRGVEVPAALPHVTAVGGTTVLVDREGRRVVERAWSDPHGNGATGGGRSRFFPVPHYQAGTRLSASPAGRLGRGVPDVALNADPESGYAVLRAGERRSVGGTSAACRAWAALVARLNEARQRAGRARLGFLNPRLYALGGRGFLDITAGDNGYAGLSGYAADPGWDAATGWGVPMGGELRALLTDA